MPIHDRALERRLQALETRLGVQNSPLPDLAPAVARIDNGTARRPDFVVAYREDHELVRLIRNVNIINARCAYDGRAPKPTPTLYLLLGGEDPAARHKINRIADTLPQPCNGPHLREARRRYLTRLEWWTWLTANFTRLLLTDEEDDLRAIIRHDGPIITYRDHPPHDDYPWTAAHRHRPEPDRSGRGRHQPPFARPDVFTYHRDDIGDTMVWEDDPDSGIIIATRDRPRIVRYLEI